MRAVYFQGQTYPNLDVAWTDDAGALIDLTALTSLSLDVFPFGLAVAFTKTIGLAAQPAVDDVVPNPNLIVTWDQSPDVELNSLAAGEYVMRFRGVDTHSDVVEFLAGTLVVRVNAPLYAYCEEADLLLGDLQVSATVNKYQFLNDAADEMNGEIGQRYLLPLNLALAPAWVALKLKGINARLATGRLIQSLDVAHQDASVNAYGQTLITGALGELAQILGGAVGLPGLPIEPTSFKATAPSITNHDAFAATEQFEQLVMRPQPFVVFEPRWRPGPAMSGETTETDPLPGPPFVDPSTP